MLKTLASFPLILFQIKAPICEDFLFEKYQKKRKQKKNTLLLKNINNSFNRVFATAKNHNHNYSWHAIRAPSQCGLSFTILSLLQRIMIEGNKTICSRKSYIFVANTHLLGKAHPFVIDWSVECTMHYRENSLFRRSVHMWNTLRTKVLSATCNENKHRRP